MKLASYRDGSRDGQLLVVSRDLATAHYATGIATRLQQLLDDWNFLSPQLDAVSQDLNHGKARHAFPFDPARCAAPLPRAFQWVRATAAPGPYAAPDLLHGRSDDFLGPRDLVALPADGAGPGLRADAQIVVVSGNLGPDTGPAAALDGVRLLLLAGGLHLSARDRAPGDWFGEFGNALSPVAVTPDELGPDWQGGQVRPTLDVQLNGKRLGPADPLPNQTWHFGELLSLLARHRGLRAGSLVGSGALPIADRAMRLQPGDTLRVEANGSDGTSLFGAIELAVAAPD